MPIVLKLVHRLQRFDEHDGECLYCCFYLFIGFKNSSVTIEIMLMNTCYHN